MSKLITIMLVPMALLCCFIGCSENHNHNHKAAFEVGDKVILRLYEYVGIIQNVEKSGCSFIYHVKVYNKKNKGYVVYRMPEKDVLEFIEEPR